MWRRLVPGGWSATRELPITPALWASVYLRIHTGNPKFWASDGELGGTFSLG
jgi:hypothetical protein